MNERFSFNFSQAAVVRGWTTVNDGVMGGASENSLTASDEGAVFSRHVSLEQGSGFASVRSPVEA